MVARRWSIDMTPEQIKARFDEIARTSLEPGDDPVAQVEAALVLEEVFGITVSDDDMTAEKLGTRQAMEQLVLERLGIAH
jgi:hypothetical protein